jgi:hypothetical protein
MEGRSKGDPRIVAKTDARRVDDDMEDSIPSGLKRIPIL